MCLKLVTESSFCVFLVKYLVRGQCGVARDWRGADKYQIVKVLVKEFDRNQRKRQKLARAKILVGF